MWALRRAAIPTRSFGRGILSVCNCLERSEPLRSILSTGDGSCLPKYCSDGSAFSGMSPWSQSFSSQSGAKYSDNEGELEDGFSDLEALPETNGVGGQCDDGASIGLSDGESDLDAEKGSRKKQWADRDVDGGTPHDAKADLDGEKKKANTRNISRSSPLFNVILKTPRESVKSALDKWVGEGNDIGRAEASVARINLRKSRLYGKALQLVEWLEANKSLDIVERDYANHLDLVAKVHGLHRAEEYTERIPESFRGEIVYRTLLANCVVSTNVKKAEGVFNKMRDLGFPVTTFACDQLLLLYKRVDRKKIADVLVLMEKYDVKPSIFTYRLLIDIKGTARDIPGMEQVVQTMKDQGVEPDLFIQGMIARHYIFCGEKEKAEAALKEMEGDGIKENRDACQLLLRLYADLGRADDVARIWKFCESGARVDECLSAIEAFGKLGQIEGAEEVFENMLKKWNKVSSKYYNALLKVYANHKLLEKGKELAKRMSDNGCNIGPLTCDALVKLYVLGGEVEKADSLLHKSAQNSHGSKQPLYSSYTDILNMYASRGDVHNAEKIFQRMKQSGYSGRMGQYQALLQAYMNAKVPVYGFRERMKADNLFPNRILTSQLAAVDPFKRTPVSDLLD